jgi:hypothetical protein
MHVAQDNGQQWALVNTVINLWVPSIEGGEFHD